MTSRSSGRLAIHRRSNEIAFLQHQLRVLSQDHRVQQDDVFDGREIGPEVLLRERDLADELLHTRQVEPLGETLQRRLAMAERICRDLVRRSGFASGLTQDRGGKTESVPRKERGQRERNNETSRSDFSDACWVAEVERRALAEMLQRWWAWLRE